MKKQRLRKIAKAAEIGRDLHVQNFHDLENSDLIDGPVVIMNNEVHYGFKGQSHEDVLTEIVGEQEAENIVFNSSKGTEIGFAYFMDDFEGTKSVFFEDYANLDKFKSLVKQDDPTVYIYMVEDFDTIKRVAKKKD